MITNGTKTHNFTYDDATAGHPGLASVTVPYIVDQHHGATVDSGEQYAAPLAPDG